MSLFEKMMVDCVRMDRDTVADGEGGSTVVWKDKDAFKAAIIVDSSLEARKAEKDGVRDFYTITVPKDVDVAYHDVFRRVSDGLIFRATSHSNDKATPAMASFQFRQFRAEEWRLTE